MGKGRNMAEVRLFQENDRDRAVSTMVHAFKNDGLYRYFIPEDGARERFLETFMAFRLRYGLKYGTVLVADEGAGVAVFLAPGHQMSPKDLRLPDSIPLPCPRYRDGALGNAVGAL